MDEERTLVEGLVSTVTLIENEDVMYISVSDNGDYLFTVRLNGDGTWRPIAPV